MMVKAVVIRANGIVGWSYVPDTLERIRGIIGVEMIGAVDLGDGAHFYCDEEGLLNGAEFNPLATRLVNEAWGHEDAYIVGDVLILGDGPDGAEADVPEQYLGMAALLAT